MEWGRLAAADGDWRTAAAAFGLAVGLFPADIAPAFRT